MNFVNRKKTSLMLAGIIIFLMINYVKADKKEEKMSIPQINDNNYLIETGKKDYERLLLLNDIVNPYSVSFLKQYIKPGDRVLEIGCGIGLMSQEIAKIVGEKGIVIGTDLSED